jgi:hypothetical protein
MTGSQGNIPNAFAALQELDNKDDDVQVVITQMAALATQSQLTATTTTSFTAFADKLDYYLYTGREGERRDILYDVNHVGVHPSVRTIRD